MSQDKVSKDPLTGEVIYPSHINAIQFPKQFDPRTARKVEDLAGKLPPWMNLKDHPDLDGVSIAIIGVQFMPRNPDFADKNSGEIRDYVRLACFILDGEGKAVSPAVIYTGAEQVVSRVMTVAPEIKPETPVVGTLRAAGRAWLLE